MSSVYLDAARDAADAAWDEASRQWEILRKIPEPTLAELEIWIAARDEADKAQGKFESIIRQIYCKA